VANEAIVNIRTVASLTKEPMFLNEYRHLIGIPHKYVLFTSVWHCDICCAFLPMKLGRVFLAVIGIFQTWVNYSLFNSITTGINLQLCHF